MDDRTKRLINRNQSRPIVKRSRRKLNYTKQQSDEKNLGSDVLFSETPPLPEETTDNLITNIVTQPDEHDIFKCILLQIPKSVSFHVLSYLNSKDFGLLEITEHET